MMQIRLRLEYDGTNYCGWQWQSGQDSIQARLEEALARIFSEQVRVRGAGRTDAGVHALGQVASFTSPRPFPIPDLHRALNALLPNDVVVREVAEAGDDFDPRRDARCRVYEYRILNQALASAFEYRYSWLLRDRLDIDAMNAVAALFVGEHDFAAFRALGSEVKSTVRRVYLSRWTRDGARLTYRIEATGFLRRMVRTMAATMVEVGRGRMTLEAVAELLGRGDRAPAPAAAPASGLFLVEVRY
ncbi:MAG: tRNA pseudouridine(38-40) synthase TruA [Candidatus Binataceae bacterium]